MVYWKRRKVSKSEKTRRRRDMLYTMRLATRDYKSSRKRMKRKEWRQQRLRRKKRMMNDFCTLCDLLILK